MRWIVAIVIALWSAIADARPQLTFAAREGRVTIFAEEDLHGVAKDLAKSAEKTLARIAADLAGLPAPEAIEVRLVREAKDLASVAPNERGAPPWAIGVAYPDLGIVSVAVQRDGRPSDPGPTLRHELGHIALGKALGPRAPRWLHEGFAYQHAGEWSWERTETLAGMAWFGSTIPIEDLEATFPREELPAHRAYAQSYDFVGFLSRRGRWEDKEDDGDRFPFRQFLAEISRGADVDLAARRTFGRPLKDLFDEWKVDFAKRFKLIPIGLFGLAIWIFCALLLVAAFVRRRRQNKRRIAQWEAEDARRAEEMAAFRIDDDPDDRPPNPRLMN